MLAETTNAFPDNKNRLFRTLGQHRPPPRRVRHHSLAQRWWRTLPDALSPIQAQAHLDAFCARVGDSRRRMRAGEATTVGALAEAL